MSRVLVTGATGLVGRRLVRLLAGRGHQVVALAHSAPADGLRHARVHVVQFDLERAAFRELPAGVEAVIALAQSHAFRSFPEHAGEIFAVNVAAHMALLEWARTSGVRRFVYASSGGVYGSHAGLQVREDQPLAVDAPLGFYLGSKLCGEVLLQNYRQFFATCAILRPFFIYGPGQKHDMLIPRLIESVRDGRTIRLDGPDGLRLNPIYVDDAAEGFAAALDTSGCRVLNLAGPEVLTLRQIGEHIGAALGRRPRFEAGAGEASNYVASIEQASAVLGAPRISFRYGLAKTIDSDFRT